MANWNDYKSVFFTSETFVLNTTKGNYRQVPNSFLGKGAFAFVYTISNGVKEFACKEYFKRFELFQNEIFMLSQLNSPHMVHLVDFWDESPDRKLLIMPLVKGELLFDHLFDVNKKKE